MKASTRKILRKIGAGLMLGLSLFNLGTAWSKAEGWNIAKRSKRLKAKEKEEVDKDVVAFAEIAEKEAKQAIEEKDLSQQTFQQEEQLSFAQKIYRVSAVGLLGIGIGILGSSMIFNAPFSLGKGLLSLLPGNPHMATISLEAQKDKYSIDEKIVLSAKVDSAGDNVTGARIVMEYNPELVFFEKLEASPEVEINEIQKNESTQQLIVFSEELSPRVLEEDQDFAKIIFTPSEMAKGKQVNFSINQNNSLVVSGQKDFSFNILGASKGASVFVEHSQKSDIACKKMDNFEGTTSFWKNYIKGNLLESRDDYWTDVDDQAGLFCSHSGEDMFLSIILPSDQRINEFNIRSDKINREADRADYFWERDGFGFYVYQLSAKGNKLIKNAEIEIRSEFFNKKKWPRENTGELTLEQ